MLKIQPLNLPNFKVHTLKNIQRITGNILRDNSKKMAVAPIKLRVVDF